MMGKYIDDSDVLISTYNKDSPMNSGARIIQFSYGRMVIVSNIEMVSEFSEDCMYSYYYASREQLSNRWMDIRYLICYGNQEYVKQ